MDSQPSFLPSAAPAHDADEDKESAAADVDPFLKEALQNPRHRLTVLRMEMDIQRFMQNPEQHYFEFQHFPTSYLRLAAHRVAQHYTLHSTVLDNSVDGSGSKIIVQKTAQSKYPCICLSEIPTGLPENEKSEQVKITIRPRPQRSSSASELGLKKSPTRTVEERKEEYDRARARIFSSSRSSDMEGTASHLDTIQGRSSCSSRKESELDKNMADEMENQKSIIKDSGSNSRVAIFRDREKDLSDPDYDRSYDRYVRSLTAHQNVGPGGAFAIFQAPFVPYETNLPHPSQLPRAQSLVNYRPSNHMLSPYCATASNQPSQDHVYMHWPSPAMMYAQSYEHFRHAIVQPPFYQQPLSFDHLQNH